MKHYEYDILRELGTNGREIVYIGKNVKKYVALKHFRITDDDNRKNVKKELERRRKEEPFKHPYLAEIIDVFEEKEYVYVVTELCLYGSLNKFYKLDIKLPEEFIRLVLFMILSALNFLHNHNEYHGNLKATNILISADKKIKLVDMEIESMIDDIEDRIKDNYYYMSPELVVDSTSKDSPEGLEKLQKSDMWMLGVLGYRLCENQIPFVSSDDVELSKEFIQKNPKEIEGYSNDLKRIIGGLLKKNSSERSSAGDLLSDPYFKPFLRSEEITVSVPDTQQFLSMLKTNSYYSQQPEEVSLTPLINPNYNNDYTQPHFAFLPYVPLSENDPHTVLLGEIKSNLLTDCKSLGTYSVKPKFSVRIRDLKEDITKEKIEECMNKSDYGEYEIKLHKIKKRDKNKMLAVISFKDAEKREIFMEKGFIEIDNNIYHISDLSLLSKSAQATYSSTSSQFPKENVPKEFEFQNEDDVVLGDVDLDSKIDYNNPPENNDKRELENYIRNQKEKVEMREKDDKNNIETDEVDKTFVSGEDSYFINTGFVKGEFDNSVFVGGGGSITLTELSEIVDHCGEVRNIITPAPSDGRPKGHYIIVFDNEKSVKNALELDGMYHKDKDCVLTFKKVEKTLYFDEIVNLKYEENEKGTAYFVRKGIEELITRPVIALAPVSVGMAQFIKIKKPSIKIHPDIFNHNNLVGTITFDTIEEAIEAWRCKFDCKIPHGLNFARSLRLSFVSPWNERNVNCLVGLLHDHKNEDINLNKTYMLNALNKLGIESKRIKFHIPDIFIKLDKEEEVDKFLLAHREVKIGKEYYLVGRVDENLTICYEQKSIEEADDYKTRMEYNEPLHCKSLSPSRVDENLTIYYEQKSIEEVDDDKTKIECNKQSLSSSQIDEDLTAIHYEQKSIEEADDDKTSEKINEKSDKTRMENNKPLHSKSLSPSPIVSEINKKSFSNHISPSPILIHINKLIINDITWNDETTKENINNPPDNCIDDKNFRELVLEIKNLPWTVCGDALEKTFKNFKFSKIKIIVHSGKDQETKAFIYFLTPEERQKAQNKTFILDGKQLTLERTNIPVAPFLHDHLTAKASSLSPKSPFPTSGREIVKKESENLKWIDDKYTYLCDLGVGGYGFVALVKKNETPISVDGLPSSPPIEGKNIRPVFLAVKYGINSQNKHFENEVAFVEKEVKKLSENCPYIVKIEEIIKIRRYFIVMEFCGRGNLDNLIKKISNSPFTPKREKLAVFITYGIACGLMEFHKKGIVYNDLKESNVVIRDDGSICLIDFGTARFITEELNHVGTYFPPERNEKMPSFFRNKAFLKSDIWNLGLVMYELMFSNGQFDKKRLYNFYLNEGNKKIEIPENNYSDDLIKLINKMLEFDVEKRPSVQEVVDQLKSHLPAISSSQLSPDSTPNSPSSTSSNIHNIDELYGNFKPDLLLDGFDGKKITFDDNGDIISLENVK